jgi:hypothetical protein
MIYANGSIPDIITIFLVFKYQGFEGTILGTVFIFPGFFIFFFFIPINAPNITRGDEQHIQKTSRARMSINFIYIICNFTAAEDCSIFRTKFIKKNIEKAKLGYKNVVNKAFFNHSLPYFMISLLQTFYKF